MIAFDGNLFGMQKGIMLLFLELQFHGFLCTDHNFILELINFFDGKIFLRGLRVTWIESILKHFLISNNEGGVELCDFDNFIRYFAVGWMRCRVLRIFLFSAFGLAVNGGSVVFGVVNRLWFLEEQID